MLDDATASGSLPAPRCNWCSAVLPSDHEVTCPSCGATLLGDGDPSVPGLTAIDAEAILRNARAAKAKPRGRLLSWISGDYDEGAATVAAAPGSLGPPTGDVRREMLRLEIEAQLTNAQAEAEALAADAAVEEGRSLEPQAGPVHDDVPPGEATGAGDLADVESAPTAVTAESAPAQSDAPTESDEADATAESDEAPPA